MVESQRSLRSQNFRKLAVRVFHGMQYELEDIEALLNVKYQRKMLNALLESDNGVHMWLLNYRWQLRTIQHADPFSSLSSSRPVTLSDRDFAEARKYLSQWLDDPHAPQKTAKLSFQVAFEIADQLFAAEAYHDATKYCQLAKKIADSNPPLIEELNRAKELPSFKLAPSTTSPQETALPRSTMALPTIFDRLEAFLEVLDDSKVDSPTSRLETLSSALERDKSSSATIKNDILQLLEAHMCDEAIPIDMRLQLEHNHLLAPVRPQIVSLNLMWRLLQRKEDHPSLEWTLGLQNHLDIFTSLVRHWSSINRPVDLRPRFYRLCFTICWESRDDRIWSNLESLCENAVEISELHHHHLLVSSNDFVPDTISTPMDSDTSDAFQVVTSSSDFEMLLASAHSLAAERGSQLVYSILMQRARRCESQEDALGAVTKYDVLKSMKDFSTDSRVLWAHLLASIDALPPPFDASTVLESVTQLLHQNLVPTGEDMERLVTDLMNRAGRAPFSQLLALLSSHFANGPSSHNLHGGISNITSLVDHIWCLCEVGERLHPSLDPSQLSAAFHSAALHLDSFLQCLLQDSSLVYRILDRLRNCVMLTTLASFLLFSLQFVYSSSNIPCDSLRADRLSKSMASVSLEKSHSWLVSVKSLAFTFEPQLFSLTVFALQRILQTCSSSTAQYAGAAFALGDLNMHKTQYAAAMRYFLLAGGSLNFSYEISDISQLLPSLIHCLTEAKLYHFAIILHQYAQNIDYQGAIHLCTTWGQFFPTEMLTFLFDISIMEALVYTLKRHGAMDRAQLIVDMISKSDKVAMHATDKNVHRNLDLSRHKLFQILVDQLLDGGNWNG